MANLLECKRCHFVAQNPCILIRHLERKKTCEPTFSDISCTELLEEIKKYIVNKKPYQCKFCEKKFACRQSRCVHERSHKDLGKLAVQQQELLKHQKTLLEKQRLANEHLARKLEEVTYTMPKKQESFYQAIVEEYLGGTHKRIMSNDECVGITDITTDTIHAEIKTFSCFKEACGQLLWYGKFDPGKELQMYLFGDIPTGRRAKLICQAIQSHFGIKVFTFEESSEKVFIVCMETGKILFTKYMT